MHPRGVSITKSLASLTPPHRYICTVVSSTTLPLNIGELYTHLPLSHLQLHVFYTSCTCCIIYRRQKWISYLTSASGWIGVAGVSGGMLVLGLPVDSLLTAAILGSVAMGIYTFIQTRRLKDLATRLSTPEAHEVSYRKLYARKLAERDEDTQALWIRVSEILRHGSVTSQDIAGILVSLMYIPYYIAYTL